MRVTVALGIATSLTLAVIVGWAAQTASSNDQAKAPRHWSVPLIRSN